MLNFLLSFSFSAVDASRISLMWLDGVVVAFSGRRLVTGEKSRTLLEIHPRCTLVRTSSLCESPCVGGDVSSPPPPGLYKKTKPQFLCGNLRTEGLISPHPAVQHLTVWGRGLWWKQPFLCQVSSPPPPFFFKGKDFFYSHQNVLKIIIIYFLPIPLQ